MIVNDVHRLLVLHPTCHATEAAALVRQLVEVCPSTAVHLLLPR